MGNTVRLPEEIQEQLITDWVTAEIRIDQVDMVANQANRIRVYAIDDRAKTGHHQENFEQGLRMLFEYFVVDDFDMRFT